MAFSKKHKVSNAVQSILDDLLRRQGDEPITAEEASNMYGGSFPTTVKELGTVELLQVALLEAYVLLGTHTKAKNRAERRKANRK